MTDSNFETLVSLYRRLGIVVLELRQDKSLWLLSTKPEWLSTLVKLEKGTAEGKVHSIT